MSLLVLESPRVVRPREGNQESRHGQVTVRREGDRFVVYKDLKSEAFEIPAECVTDLIRCFLELGGRERD